MKRHDNGIRARLLDKMLLHGHVTRKQIVEGFGISKVAASRHADSLKTSGLARSHTRRLPAIRRPVEFLHVNNALATALAVRLSRHEVAAEIVDAGGTTLQSHALPVETARQLDVLDRLRELLDWAGKTVTEARRQLDLAGFAVNGFVEPSSGMLFGVRDIPDWQPCHLGNVVEALADIPCYPWTAVSCRLRGFAKRIGSDHRVGYIVWSEHELAIASMVDGAVRLGRFGTGGGQVHHTVSDSPVRCICGQQGCLGSHLLAGDTTPEMILQALPDILAEIDAETVGIEWPHSASDVTEACRNLGLTAVDHARDGLALETEGVRMACARAMLLGVLADQQHNPRRDIVNHDAFRMPISQTADSAVKKKPETVRDRER